MKKTLLLVVVFAVGVLSFLHSKAQVGINNDGLSADSSAMLDVRSTNKGFLPPRVVLTSLLLPNPIVNPKKGLIVYNENSTGTSSQDVPPGFYMWNGAQWLQASLPHGIQPGTMLYWDGVKYVGLPVGAPGQILGVSSASLPVWMTAGIATAPTVLTSVPTEVYQTSFKAGGNVVGDGGSLVTDRGVAYSINPNPTVSGTKASCGMGLGAFSVVISGLSPNTQYYLRAYAINNFGTAYGDQVFVQTLPLMVPTVVTTAVTNITGTTATSGGNVLLDGGSDVYFKGVCWDTIPLPTLVDPRTIDGAGTGSFVSLMTGLIPGKKYYVRAYAVNGTGTSYSSDSFSFNTLCGNNIPPTVLISSTANSICSGSSVTFTATSANAGTNPAYQWKVNGVNTGLNSSVFTYIPVNNDLVACVVTSGDPCTAGSTASSNIIGVTVNPVVTAGITITSSSNSVCNGTLVNFVASAINGGSAPQYQWKVNGINIGENSPFYAYVPANNDEVACSMISSANCASSGPVASNVVAITVIPILPVDISITLSQNNVCAGTSVTCSATAVNGGVSPAYQWKVNGIYAGTNSSSFSYTPVNGDVITCTLSSSIACPTANPVVSNAVTVTVNPILPVSLIVTASSNPICSGTTVTYSATTVNAGSSPSFQWKVNGLNAGNSGQTFVYTPLNNDVISCVLTSSEICTSGNPYTSSGIIMTVNPVLPVSISVAPNLNPVCSGTPVTFSSTIVNGGSSPAYQWFKNGTAIIGAINATYSYVPVNSDAITCSLTSSAICPTGNPAISNAIYMIVNPVLAVSVSIEASANQICAGSAVVFSAIPINGGTQPLYQWKKNGNDIPGATNSQYSYAPDNNDLITCKLTSNATCPSGNPATSNGINMVVNPLLPVSVSILESANSVCAGASVTYTATHVNGGSSPVFQWKKNGTIIAGASSSTYGYSPSNNDAINCVLTSNAMCATGNPAISNIVNMVINPLLPVSVSITTTANTVCQGTSVTFTAAPVNAGTNPLFQWKKNGTIIIGANSPTYTYAPSNNDALQCELTSSALCNTGNPALSNTITITVNPLLPVSVSVTASANSVCTGASVIFSATSVNGGSTPGYQWKKNGAAIAGATNSTYAYAPVNNDAVSCVIISNVVCPVGNPATSNAINMVVNPLLTVAVSIAASANPVCAGSSVTFTASPVNGGTLPSYQWKNNGIPITGATSSAFSFVPANNDIISCVLTSNAACVLENIVTSGGITMSVNPLAQISVAIEASGDTVCAGTAVTFTATPVNGGSSPAYQWKVNGNNVGTNNPAFSYVPSNNDAVTCDLNSDLSCTTIDPVTSNTIIITVNPTVIAAVSITVSANPVCSGTSAHFTATTVNGGTIPLYQWKVNGIEMTGATSDSYDFIPFDNDAVSCTMTSNAICATNNPATSNLITMSVTATMTVGVTISASSDQICAGDAVTYTASQTNGGSSPIYQWFVNGTGVGTNSVSLTYNPADNDSIYCKLTSSSGCAENNPAISNIIKMVVNPLVPVSLSITASENPVCAQTSVTFSAIPVNGGPNPAYLWKVNGNTVGSGGQSFQYVPANNDVITCLMQSGAVCTSGNPAISNAITMLVNPANLVSVNISSSSNPVCSGNEVTFSASTVNGGSAPSYQWQKNGVIVPGATNSTYVYVPSDNDAMNCIVTSLVTCSAGSPATSNTITMEVNEPLVVGVVISESANPVCDGADVTFTANALNGGTDPAYQWHVNGNNVGQNLSTYTYSPVSGDQVYCTVTSIESCTVSQSSSSNVIEMVVNPILPVSLTIAASQNPVCEGSSVTFTAFVVNGGTAPVFHWQLNNAKTGSISVSSDNTFTIIPSNNDIITCILTSNETCPSATQVNSNAISMIVNSLAIVGVAITPSSNNICAGTPVTFNATPQNGGTNPSFQWTVNGINAGSNGPIFSYEPLNNDMVICVLTSNLSCVTASQANSNMVNMDVNQSKPVSVSVTSSKNPVCAGSSVTFYATAINGGPTPQFTWMVNGVIVEGANGSVYSYIPDHNDVVNCLLTSSEVCAVNNPAASNAEIMTVNPLQPVSIAISASGNEVCSGTSVTFSSVIVNGGSVPVYDWKINGNSIGVNSPAMTYAPANSDSVSCLLISNALCAIESPASSNKISMNVDPLLPVSVSVTAPVNTVCAGIFVSFSATPLNGGTIPVYQWMVNGNNLGANAPSLTYLPSDNDEITCKLTSSLNCVSENPAFSLPFVMTVNPLLPVGISVAPSANPVCTGSSVAFAATSVNPGSTPVYQWKVNNANVGTNSPAYTYIPANNDHVSCLLTSNALCTTGNPATSEITTMSVYTLLYVGSISASQNICAGTSPSMLTGTPPSNGSTPTYQWQKSTDNISFSSIEGATSLNYQPEAIFAKTYFRQLQNAAGTCGGPLPTNVIVVSVTQPEPVSVTISANPAGVVYLGTSVTFTALGSNGGINPGYQWMVNGLSQGAGTQTFTYIPANNDQVKCLLTSSGNCVSGNPATSNTISMIVSNDPLLPVTVAINANPIGAVCSGTEVIYSALAGNGGSNPQYQWKVNGVDAGLNSATFTYTPANNDQITCVLTSSLINITGNPATSNIILAVVNPNLPVDVAISASSNPVCEGASVTFIASPVNGGSSPDYEWMVNGQVMASGGYAFSYIPQNNDLINCSMVSSEICTVGNPAVSNSIEELVNPLLPVSITITASANPVCSGTEVTFTSEVVNGGTNPEFHWKVNGLNVGSNTPTFTYVPSNNEIVTCVLTSQMNCTTGNPAVSNSIGMVVNQTLPVSVVISSSASTVCSGTSVLFMATAQNGGSSPVYQWKVNGTIQGGNLSLFSFVPNNNDVVTCKLFSTYNCSSGNPATSNSISVSVNPLLPVSVSVAASANPSCMGNIVNYTATAVNGGSGPVFQWKINDVNAGSNEPVFAYTPGNNDVIKCILTSNATCAQGSPATSASIVMTVNELLPVSVSIAASANNVCAGTSVNYTASAMNAGPSPVYQWKVDGVDVGTNSAVYSYVPEDDDVITCKVTASGACLTGNPAISAPVVMNINPLLTAGVSISASATTICSGTNVTFTALPVNGGSNPQFSWKVNGITVGNGSGYTYKPNNNDQVVCTLTSNASCVIGSPATSVPVGITVNPLLPVSISILASANPVCAGSNVTLTATPVNGGSNPIFLWRVNGTAVGTSNLVYSYTPLNNDIVNCELTSSYGCSTGNPATSNSVTMSVNQPVTPGVSITASANNVCGGTIVSFTATPVNGGLSPTYQWKVNGVNAGSSTTSNTYAYAPANADVVSCSMSSTALCPSTNPALSNSISMVVSASPAASVSIASSATSVCNGTSVTCTATPLNGGTTPVYQWVRNGANVGNGSASYEFTPANGDIVKCVMTSSLTCVTGSPATSNSPVFTVTPVLPVSVIITANPVSPVCQGTTVVFSATPTNGGTSPAYQWKKNGTNVTGATNATYSYALTSSDIITCDLTSSASCPSGNPATSNALTMVVNASVTVSAILSASAYATMPGTVVNYTVTPTNGGTSPTYQWKVNNVAVGTNSNTYSYTPANNDNILCVVTSNLTGCVTANPANSNTVNMVVYSTGTACTGVPTVVYGGMTYNTVQIGTQCWLRENINYGTKIIATSNQTNNSIAEKYCYSNSDLNCNVYGGLYQWAEMVQYYNNVTNTTHWATPWPTVVQGICPTGWHIPTNDEANALVANLGGQAVAGGKLKELGIVHWNSTNAGASNSSGFTALPGGYAYGGTFGNIKSYGFFWTITRGQAATDAYYFGASYNFVGSNAGQSYKVTGYPVRCLKN